MTLEMASGSAHITRFDRQRSVSIKADVGSAPLGEVNEAIAKLPAIQQLPAYVQQVQYGDSKRMIARKIGRCRLPRADGHRRDRRLDHLDRAALFYVPVVSAALTMPSGVKRLVARGERPAARGRCRAIRTSSMNAPSGREAEFPTLNVF